MVAKLASNPTVIQSKRFMSFTLSVSEVEASSPLCPLLVYTLGALDGAGLPELIWELTAILDLTGLRTGFRIVSG